jgi:hypothetical protein
MIETRLDIESILYTMFLTGTLDKVRHIWNQINHDDLVEADIYEQIITRTQNDAMVPPDFDTSGHRKTKELGMWNLNSMHVYLLVNFARVDDKMPADIFIAKLRETLQFEKSKLSTPQNAQPDQLEQRKSALEKISQLFVHNFGDINRPIELGDDQTRWAPIIDNGK